LVIGYWLLVIGYWFLVIISGKPTKESLPKECLPKESLPNKQPITNHKQQITKESLPTNK
jgi:hypothetical protein